MTPVEILTEAKRLVQSGWIQGALAAVKNDTMCYCLEGAIVVADGGKVLDEKETDLPDDDDEDFFANIITTATGRNVRYQVSPKFDLTPEGIVAFEAVYDTIGNNVLSKALYARYAQNSLLRFNDMPDTTKEDVIKVLDAAIKSLDTPKPQQ
jgi:hypothetical protein